MHLIGFKTGLAANIGPGHIFLRAGPGPGLMIQFAGRARAGPGPGLHNCCGGPGQGLGLKSYLRAEPGPKCQARAGP